MINPSGYNAISYTPATTGDFMFDENIPLVDVWLNFDITVVDTTITPYAPITGRVWCKYWGIWANDPLGPGYMATMYVLPEDSVVTSVNFNGLNATDAGIALNRNGLFPPPANWLLSRQSRIMPPINWASGYLEHKIFLNDPDTMVYPSGTMGLIMPNSFTVIPDCDGTVMISFLTTKPGLVELQIQIDPDPAIQPIDVVIIDSVTAGINSILWNGINGLGQPVPNGIPFYVSGKYLNGLTNLPIAYTWSNPNGFIVQLKRPVGPTPLLYWDDRKIDSTNYNLTGCLSNPPTSGCHTWTFGTIYSWNNTINTWWYASTTPAVSSTVLFKRFFANITDTAICLGSTFIWQGNMYQSTGTDTINFPTITGCDSIYILNLTVNPSPIVNLGPDRIVCNGDSVTFNAGSCAGCTYRWDYLTLGQMNIDSTQTYTTNLPGYYKVTVTGQNGCAGKDSVHLFNSPIPIVTNDPLSESICTGQSTNINLTSNAPGATFSWSASLTSGSVSGFSADSGLIINQVLFNTSASASVVTYHITPKVGSCIGIPSDYTVTVTPGDSVKVSITSSANNICAGIPVTFTATPTNGGANPMYQWKVNGISIGGNSPVYSYNPLNGDIVTCTLTSSNLTCVSNNPALSNQVIMVINSNLPVIVVISASQNPVCSNVQVAFTATPTNSGGAPQYQWKVNGVNVGGEQFNLYVHSGQWGCGNLCVDVF